MDKVKKDEETPNEDRQVEVQINEEMEKNDAFDEEKNNGNDDEEKRKKVLSLCTWFFLFFFFFFGEVRPSCRDVDGEVRPSSSPVRPFECFLACFSLSRPPTRFGWDCFILWLRVLVL